MKVKVCGMRNHRNIEELLSLNPDYIGFIFYAKSPRFVGEDYEVPQLPSSIIKVGVFVNEYIEEVQKKIQKYSLDAVQLHGDETPEYCQALRQENEKLLIIKAFAIANESDIKLLDAFSTCCDLFILDSKGKSYGGNGHMWNHKLLQNQTINTPFLLSGGIDEKFDLSTLIEIHPLCIGVDLNSKFEIEPGLKDIQKLKIFMR